VQVLAINPNTKAHKFNIYFDHVNLQLFLIELWSQSKKYFRHHVAWEVLIELFNACISVKNYWSEVITLR
jgi:hypothetical protein